MFLVLYFIMPLVCTLLAIAFTVCINENLPKGFTYNLGKINADDIRNMDTEKRNNLRSIVMIHFIMILIVSLGVSVTFVLLGFHNNGLALIPCNLISLCISMIIIVKLVKKCNNIKQNLR